MFRTNATLTDWDGQITVLEREELDILCSGNKENCKNIDGQRKKKLSTEDETEQNGCGTSVSSFNRSVNDDKSLCEINCNSEADKNESQDETSRHSSVILGSFYHHIVSGSSQLGESVTEVMIDDCQSEQEPTSAILNYCQKKVLRPYVAILSIVGLNPISTDASKCQAFISYLQCCILINVLVFGYFLQYLTSYRNDRGFSASINKNETYTNINSLKAVKQPDSDNTTGELLFGFVIPSILNLAGYMTAVVLCKFIDHEQLQNLIERTFLMSMNPKILHRSFWIFISASFTLYCCLHAYFVPEILSENTVIRNKWFGELNCEWQFTLKICLIITLSIQNFVEIIILSSYSIECYMLKIHLYALSQKLLLHSISTMDWMREILQFRKLLDRLNNHVSIPVSFFVVMNLASASAGFLFMFKNSELRYSILRTAILNFINVLLRLVLGLLPFFMAASLTEVCRSIKSNGHQIRTRPFVYHNTSAEDLNSMLMFSSTMDMSAKLFQMPIQFKYIYFALFIISVIILALGMCFSVSILDIFKI